MDCPLCGFLRWLPKSRISFVHLLQKRSPSSTCSRGVSVGRLLWGWNECNVRHAYTNAWGTLPVIGPRQSCPKEAAVPTCLPSLHPQAPAALLLFFTGSVMQWPKPGLPLGKGKPLYVVTKHTKFNYSGKWKPCCQRQKVIHMSANPSVLFCFPWCFHYVC